jgi:hypothetical protein
MASELRCALDAVNGKWSDPEPPCSANLSPYIPVIPPAPRPGRFKPALQHTWPWLGRLSNNPTLATVLGGLILAELLRLIF